MVTIVGAGAAVLLRNFGQTCAGQSVSNDCGLIDVERHAIDLLAFESRPSHSSAHVLDHQVSLKLGDCVQLFPGW
jgi:hypothetical protein